MDDPWDEDTLSGDEAAAAADCRLADMPEIFRSTNPERVRLLRFGDCWYWQLIAGTATTTYRVLDFKP